MAVEFTLYMPRNRSARFFLDCCEKAFQAIATSNDLFSVVSWFNSGRLTQVNLVLLRDEN